MRSLIDTAARDESPETQQLLEESRERMRKALDRRERRVEVVTTALFAAGTAAVALLASGGQPLRPAVVVFVILAGLVCVRAQLPVGAGFTAPILLAEVPALFLLPAGAVPPTIAAVYLLTRAIDAATGRLAPGRVWLGISHATPSLGPALVFALAAPGAPDPADWPVYLGAMVVMAAIDFGNGALHELILSGLRPAAFLRETAWIYVLDAVLWPIAFAFALASDGRPWAVLLLVPLGGLLAAFARERRRGIDRLLALSSAYRGTALLLGSVVEADDNYTGLHSQGVVVLAVEVADRLGVDAATRERVEFGALLHDVGKIAIPKEIINKPGALDDDEWALMKTHTIEGQRMLDHVGGAMSAIGTIVRASHESFDGRGYPDGLAGEEIPLEARIICCCDAFNAMTTDRSYSAARPVADAIAELRRCSGAQFDPAVVAALIEVVEGDGAMLPDPGLAQLSRTG
jgi:HD-GYP domain-containing protein (c-di-GMP phosphodiesterase class II)